VSPTIRIDEAVWEWLKSHARPFEDTPNSVLRRLAGLDPLDDGPRDQTARARSEGAVVRTLESRLGRRVTGEALNRTHALGARHALYHKDGTFYERLADFPGVLCDTRGYVSFETRDQFEHDPRLEIGQKVNIPRGLSSHPRYKLFPSTAPDKGTQRVG
jgi:hypothetical protein